MDAISYSHSAKQAQRIEKFIENPDSIAGLVTVPNLVPTGETVSIPTGRTLVHPNLQVDGTLTVDGTLFIPSGSTYTATEVDATVVKQNGSIVANDSAVVHKTGNETIAGVKTFSSDISGLSAITGKKVIMVDTENSRMLYLRYLLGFNRIDSYNSPITNATPLLINSSELHLQIDDSTKLKIDTSGNVLVTGSGGLGYGAGSGGTVTQITSKSTEVTLNKPCGQITMNNESLAAGAVVYFLLKNSTITFSDTVVATFKDGSTADIRLYRVEAISQGTGYSWIKITNTHSLALAESPVIKFAVIKGATA